MVVTNERRACLFARLFAIFSVLAGLFLLAIGLWVDSVLVPLTPWRLPGQTVLIVGGAVILWGVFLVWLPARVGLASSMLLTTVIVFFTLGYRPPQAGEMVVHVQRAPVILNTAKEWYDEYIGPHPVYGHSPVANTKSRHHHRDYDVVYNIGPDGFRVMPDSSVPSPQLEILFLGCSFTFGVGVDDAEIYPAILAKEAWPEFKVRNISSSGWGTGHCYLALVDALKRPDPPACVFYAYIDNHLKRNSRRKSWRTSNNAKFPDFDTDGRWLGLSTPDVATMEDCEETYAIEKTTTLNIIRHMREMCDTKRIPFFVLLLQSEKVTLSDDLLVEPDLNVIDLRDSCAEVHPHDFHPTRRTHREIASAIAANPTIAKRTGINNLYRPGSIPWQPIDPVEFVKIVNTGTDATLQRLSNAADGIRIEDIRLGSPGEYEVQIGRPCPPLKVNSSYRLSYKARADKRRKLGVMVSRRIHPYTTFGLKDEVDLTTTWNTYEHTFTSTHTDSLGLARFLIGTSDIPVEIADVSIQRLNPETTSSPREQTARLDLPRSMAMATLRMDSGNFRVENIHSAEKVAWHVQMTFRNFSLEADHDYTVTCRARAERPRPMTIAVVENYQPFTNAGLFETVTVGTDWQTISLPFRAKKSDDQIMLSFCVGASEVPLEVSRPELLPGSDYPVRQPSQQTSRASP